MSRYWSLKETDASYEQKVVPIEKPAKNDWPKTKTSSKNI